MPFRIPVAHGVRTLPPATQPSFSRFMSRVNAGLGPERSTRITGIWIGPTQVLVGVTAGGQSGQIVLSDPSGRSGAASSRYFDIRAADPLPRLPAGMIPTLAVALDAEFHADPFVDTLSNENGSNPRRAATLEDEVNRVLVEMPHDQGIVSRAYVMSVGFVLLVSVAAAASRLVRGTQDQDLRDEARRSPMRLNA